MRSNSSAGEESIHSSKTKFIILSEKWSDAFQRFFLQLIVCRIAFRGKQNDSCRFISYVTMRYCT